MLKIKISKKWVFLSLLESQKHATQSRLFCIIYRLMTLNINNGL